RARWAPIARRLRRAQRPTNGVAVDAEAAHQLLDRHAAHEMLATKLGPALHVQHNPSPGLGDMTEPGSPRPRTSSPPLRGVNFQPAKGGEFCTGADSRLSGPNEPTPRWSTFRPAKPDHFSTGLDRWLG